MAIKLSLRCAGALVNISQTRLAGSAVKVKGLWTRVHFNQVVPRYMFPINVTQSYGGFRKWLENVRDKPTFEECEQVLRDLWPYEEYQDRCKDFFSSEQAMQGYEAMLHLRYNMLVLPPPIPLFTALDFPEYYEAIDKKKIEAQN